MFSQKIYVIIAYQEKIVKPIDLHSHSNKSDGTCTPSQLIQKASDIGLAAIALTDHDTIDGIDEAVNYARQNCLELEVIPGIEYSTDYNGRDVHIVGLYIDYRSESFRSKLKAFIDSRATRNIKMCRKLTDAGFPVTVQQLADENPGAVITRAHYAKFFVEHGYAKTRAEVFEKYIGDSCPYFVSRQKVTPEQAVRMILDGNGIPVLAHPVLYRMPDAELRGLVLKLKAAGLIGIEAIYSTYTQADERYIRKIAADYELCISGGSDFHGENKPDISLGTGLGNLFVPYDILEKMKKAAYSGK